MNDRENKALINIQGLCKNFGQTKALVDVDFQVMPGRVYGIVGENGAGKTTLVKHILGLLRPDGGRVKVFGCDPVAEPEEVLARIGYLSENPELPSWMRIRELLNYLSAFYQNWDMDYAYALLELFDLDPEATLKTLSKGQLARAGLVAAQAYRPEILLLDEPSSGLDPVVRRDILTSIIRTVVDQGRTVVFSSHLLEEVERVCDHITMIHKGRVVLSEDLDEVLVAHHRVLVRSNLDLKQFARTIPGLLSFQRSGDEWSCVLRGELELLRAEFEDLGCEVLSHKGLSLNDVFVALSIAKKNDALAIHQAAEARVAS